MVDWARSSSRAMWPIELALDDVEVEADEGLAVVGLSSDDVCKGQFDVI